MPWILGQSNFQLWTRHTSVCRLWRQIFRCLCLALTLTAFLLPTTSVRADGGAGGASGGAGGAGGTGTNGAAGAAGGNNLLQGGGGGGGGGAGGGTGGAGGSGVGGSNASGGTSATPDGANGSTAILGTASAGGGGGGAGGTNGNGAGAATIANIGPLSAANGGSGGAGGNANVLNGGGGGGGGGGGYGALITGTGSSSNSSMISAGNGGAGGAGGSGGPVLSTNAGGNGGSGGSGGIGASFSAPGATFVNAATATVRGGNGGNGGNGGSGTSLPFLGAGGSGGNGGNGGIGISASGLTLTNAGTINGGSGGTAGSGGTGGTNGAAGTIGSGGIGIAGSNLTIVNSGTISGGLAGDGITRANAISFTGGSNSLELDADSSITGNVVGTGSDTFKLGGSANSTFAVSAIGPAAQYRGFSTFQKVGTSTWTLTGTTSAATPWTLMQGALSVSSDSNLGAAGGALTFNGGTLQVTGTGFTSTPRTINWGANGGGFDIAAAANVFSLNQSLTGTGSLTKLGAGTLLLSGANAYGGGTTISAGTLQAGAANTLSANSSISVAGGATLDLNGFDQSIGSLSGSGNATLGGATLTTGGDNTSTAFSGLISGSGGIIKTGSGTFTLSGANSYNGGTTISAGTLLLSGSGTLGATSNTTTVSGGTLNFGGTTQTQAALNQSGGTVQTGTIHVANYQLTGGTLASDATVAAATTFDIQAGTANGVLAGGGALNKTTAGTVTLAGTNGYSGGTTISAGTLLLSGAGTLGATSNTTAMGGGTLDLGGTVQTQAALNQSGGTVQTGTIHVANYQLTGGTLASDATIVATKTFDMQAGTANGVLTGPGALTKTTAGTVVLSGANSYIGNTSISAGILRAGAANTLSANSAVSISGGATLDLNGFNQAVGSLAGDGTVSLASATLTTGGNNATTQFAGTISGNGGVTKDGTGVVTLSGANSYVGTTTVNGGTLSIAADNNLGNGGSLALNDNTTLNFAAAFTLNHAITLSGDPTFNVPSGQTNTISAAIADGASPGDLVLTGGGTLILPAANSYTGTTTVNAGTLRVDGSIASSSLTSVNSGAVLTGLGTLGNTQVHGGGTLVPGAAGLAGTSVTIAGTLTLAAGSIYSVTISAATASKANVSGTATLAGNVLATFTVGTYIAKQYTILHSGGLSGAFSSLQTSNLPAGFTAALSYSGLDAFLNLTATLGNNQNNGQNTQTVADSVNSYFNMGGGMPANFARVYALTGDDLRFALTQLSGEAMTGGQEVAAAMTDGFLVTMLDPFVNAGGAGISRFDANFHACRVGLPRLPRESPDPNGCLPQWSVWSVTYGATQSMKGDPFGAGTHDFDGAVYSSVSGLDYHLTSETVVGFAAGGGSTTWSLAQGLGGGRSSAVQAGLYAVTKMGGFYVADALSFANHWMATDRYSFGGDHLMTNFGAQAFGERFESGYRLALPSLLPWPVSASWLPPVALTPYVAFEAQDFQTPTVNEQDLSGGGFGLSYAPHHSIQAHTELGTRISIELLQTRGMSLNLWARGAWAYGVVDDTPLAASFQNLLGTNLEVQGVRPARNSAITTLGCALDLGNGLSFAVTSDAHFADNAGAYEARATLRYAW